MGKALVQIPTQKRPLPIERDKPVRALFMKFHFIPPWQPFKQWLWGNVPPRMSNNSQDQQLFCVTNTLIKRVKVFLPESIKDCFMKDTCKQEQNKAQTKVFCTKDATFVSYHNQFPLCATAKDQQKHVHRVNLVLLRQFTLQLWNTVIHDNTGTWVKQYCVLYFIIKVIANTVEWISRTGSTYIQQTLFSVMASSIFIVFRWTYGPSTKL